MRRCIEIVLMKSESVLLLWDSNGMNYVATDSAAAVRWIEAIAADANVKDVEFSSPRGGAFTRTASRVLDQLAPQEAEAEAPIGLHVVLQLNLEPWSCVVWAPKGHPRAATDVAKLATLLDELVADESQPRVPAGPPPDPSERLLEGAGQLVQRWLQG